MFYYVIFEMFLEWWYNYFGWPLDKANIIYLMWCGSAGASVAFVHDLFFSYRILDPIFYKYELFGYKKEKIVVYTEVIRGTEMEAAIVGLWMIAIIFGIIVNKYIYLLVFYYFSCFSFFFNFNYINLYHLMRFLYFILILDSLYKSKFNLYDIYCKKVFIQEKINFVIRKKKKC